MNLRFRIIIYIVISSCLIFSSACSKKKNNYQPRIIKVTQNEQPEYTSTKVPIRKTKTKVNQDKTTEANIDNKKIDIENEQLINCEKWFDAFRILNDIIQNLFIYYFNHEEQFPTLERKMNARKIYQSLKNNRKLPVLKYFKPEEIILRHFSLKELKFAFRITEKDKTHNKLMLDVTPFERELYLPYELENMINKAKIKKDVRYEKFKWIKAEEVLQGFSIAFMNYLYELGDSEAKDIKSPMKLSELTRKISFDSNIFKSLSFFKQDDFILEKFNSKKRYFCFSVVSSGKFPLPRKRRLRIHSPYNWFPTEIVHVKKPKKDKDKKTKKQPGVKTKFKKLPNLKGKKVLLKFKYDTKVSNLRIAKKQPSLPGGYKNKLLLLIKKTGAKIVNSGADCTIEARLHLDVELVSYLEEVMRAEVAGTFDGTISFAGKKKNFNQNFSLKINDYKKSFENSWDKGLEVFKFILDNYFEK